MANARPKLNGTARSLGRPSLNPAGTLSSSYWSLVTVANKVYAYSFCSAVGALASEPLMTMDNKALFTFMNADLLGLYP